MHYRSSLVTIAESRPKWTKSLAFSDQNGNKTILFVELSLTIFKEPGPDVFFTLTFHLQTLIRRFAPHFCPPEIYRPNKELQKVTTGYLTHLTF